MKMEMLINKYYEQLNENDLSTLHYIIENKKKCSELSITDLANSCNISKSSVLRTAQKLGFSGFSEFKYSLKLDIDPEAGKSKSYFQQTMVNVRHTMDFFEKADLLPIYEKIKFADHIYAYGTGWAQRNAIAELKRNFLNCGRMINNIEAKRELDMGIGFLNERDLLIIISLSGDISDIIEAIRLLSVKKVPVLSITNANFDHNELASLVPYNLYYHSTMYPLKNKHQIKEDPISLVTLSFLCEALFFGYLFQYPDDKEGRE